MKTSAGFTLLEMAIVLVIIGVLLGGLLMPLSAQVETSRINETKKALDEINQALIGFAVTNGYLPCPAVSSSNGAEQTRVAGVCPSRIGFLPWAALGVSQVDAWGRLYRYSATPAFTDSVTKFTLTSAGDITVKNDNSVANIATSIPALVMSHGVNGYYATVAGGGAPIADGSATNTDEGTNGSGGTTFVSKGITRSTTATGGDYDDIVVWISPNILFNRMVSAQKLP